MTLGMCMLTVVIIAISADELYAAPYNIHSKKQCCGNVAQLA